MDKIYTTEKRRNGLRQLILFDVALFVLGFVAFFVFSDPPEITAAMEVMAEIRGSTENNTDVVLGLIILCVIVVALVLQIWAWRQLYQLDQRGVAKYLWAYGLLILVSVISGGGWSSSVLDVIETLETLCGGAILCICYLCPEVFTAEVNRTVQDNSSNTEYDSGAAEEKSASIQTAIESVKNASISTKSCCKELKMLSQSYDYLPATIQKRTRSLIQKHQDVQRRLEVAVREVKEPLLDDATAEQIKSECDEIMHLNRRSKAMINKLKQ